MDTDRGTTGTTIQEYERMINLKRERSEFIANARTETESLWEELIVGRGEEDNDFAAFADGEFLAHRTSGEMSQMSMRQIC